jgi:hypothetical protein
MHAAVESVIGGMFGEALCEYSTVCPDRNLREEHRVLT